MRRFHAYVTGILLLLVSTQRTAASQFYEQLPDYGEMLMIVYDPYMTQQSLDDFVQWKKQQGITVSIVKSSVLADYYPGDLFEKKFVDSASPKSERKSGTKMVSDDVEGHVKCCYGADPLDPDCAIVTAGYCTDTLFGTVVAGDTFCYNPCPPAVYECGTPNQIKAYITDFRTLHPDLLWVILVGNGEQISVKSWTYHDVELQQYYHESADPWYGVLEGPDSTAFPDLVIARFPVSNFADLRTLVERTITYERDLPKAGENTDWYQHATLVARADFPETDSGEFHTNIMRAIRGAISQSPLSMSSDSLFEILGTPAWNSSSLSSLLNDGTSIWFHATHGASDGLSTGTGTLFYQGDIYDLDNVDRLPVIIMSACNVAAIESGTNTFGERLVTTSDANDSAVGGVAAYVSAATQFLPPANFGVVNFAELLSEDENHSFGSLCFNAASIMKVEHSSGSVPYEMFLGWHIFGDPSLLVRTHAPETLTVAYDTLRYYDTSFTLTVVDESEQPVANALCALYYHDGGSGFDAGKLYGSAFTDGSGEAVISIADSMPVAANILLTVSGYNLKTSIQEVPAGYDLEVFPHQHANTNNISSPYTITGEVLSSTALSSGFPKLKYRVDGGSWSEVAMSLDSGNIYAGEIPAQSAGVMIEYQILAQNSEAFSRESEMLSFEVYDYHFEFTRTNADSSAPKPLYIWYTATVTNDGALDDSCSFGVSGNAWETTFWESDSVTSLVSPIALPTSDPVLSIVVRVKVEDTTINVADTATVTVTSVGDNTFSASSDFVTTSEGVTLDPPFFDPFVAGFIDSVNLWDSRYSLGLVDSTGNAVPSPPYCFHFKKTGMVNPNGPNRLTSKMINLEEESGMRFSYHYERTGLGDSPEEGDDLIFEYLDSTGAWHSLGSQPGDGPDMTTFTQVVSNLPGAAYHSKFQVRVSVPISGGLNDHDDWYVDNIAVAHIPSAPTLVSPSNGATVTSYGVTLDWYEAAGVSTRWNVQVDDDSNFNSINRQLSSDALISTDWLIYPYVSNGTWYWRVRGSIEDSIWGKWSPKYKFTRSYSNPQPPPSCPVLFHYDGNEFVRDNTLFTSCERSGYAEVVPDHFLIPDDAAIINGAIRLQLREHDDEISYIHNLELVAVDHAIGTEVSVTSNGEIIAYEGEPLRPISAVDNSGVDCLDAILTDDDIFYTSAAPGYLTVVFPKPDSIGGYAFSSTGKEPCIPDPKIPATDQTQLSTMTVTFLNAQNEWEEFENVSPRAYESYESVFSEKLRDIPSDTVVLRFSWNRGISFDAVQQLVPAPAVPEMQKYPVAHAAAIRAKNGQTDPMVLSPATLQNPIVLRKGDMLEFSFQVDTSASTGMTRSYVLKGLGRYEPDPSLFSGLLPRDFALYNNYPNPFNPSTSIAFDIPAASHVKLEVFNILGQSVSTLIDGWRDAGHHVAVWDGKNNRGEGVSTGVYFYIIEAGNFRESKKMTLVK